jgi:hypothetical protein
LGSVGLAYLMVSIVDDLIDVSSLGIDWLYWTFCSSREQVGKFSKEVSRDLTGLICSTIVDRMDRTSSATVLDLWL